MTTAWTDGYQTEVNYTFGYYKDLSPNFQKFCLLLNGVDCSSADLEHNHCELGFGQGVSLNVHATSNFGTFYGTDFNPAHAAHANTLAEQCLVPHHFYDASFEELLEKDLPMFNSISLHGIWSWISHENQHIILKFITPLSTLYNSLILKGLKFNNFLAKNCKPSIYRALEKRVESQVIHS